eukprot:scaffold78959_cov18-Prasinocladus_malaysianus.AAC.1
MATLLEDISCDVVRARYTLLSKSYVEQLEPGVQGCTGAKISHNHFGTDTTMKCQYFKCCMRTFNNTGLTCAQTDLSEPAKDPIIE